MILPSPPYRVSPTFVRGLWKQVIFFGLFGCGLLAAGLWLCVPEALHILSERDVWRRGEPALEAAVKGREKTQRLIFHSYELDVSWTGQDGMPRSGRVEFQTVFGSIDQSVPVEVRTLPEDPQRFALSWGQDVIVYRWMAALFFLAVGVGLGGLILTVPLATVVELRLANDCAHDSSEIHADAVQTKVDGNNVHYKISGVTPWGGPIDATFVANNLFGGPLFVDDAGSRVLVLVSPRRPGKALVIRDNFLPYEFDVAERVGISERLNAARKGR
jgi:hypothetical protein